MGIVLLSHLTVLFSAKHVFLIGSVGVLFFISVLVWIHRANRIPADLPVKPLTIVDDLPQKPRKISLAGNTGSGKSTFAQALESKLGVAHIDLDRMYWNEEVRNTDLIPLRRAIKDAKNGWVCDGLYKAAVLEAWGRSDIIVLLDPPPFLRMRRALLREWRVFWRGEQNQVGAKGLSRLAWSSVVCMFAASGLGRQRRYLFDHIRSFQTTVRNNYHHAVRKREEQRQNGQTPKETFIRESIPLLILRSEHEAQLWLNNY